MRNAFFQLRVKKEITRLRLGMTDNTILARGDSNNLAR